jgi:hypothetical protein
MPADEIQAAYEAACRAWNEGRAPVSHEAFLASRPCQQAIPLMYALRAKGFALRSPNAN